MDPSLQRLEPFWYPVMPIRSLAAEPTAVTLLGRPLVLWRGADGHLRCPYHGWAFDTEGHCREVSQQPGQLIPDRCHTRAYPVQERHGLVWVCLAPEAKLPIPDFTHLGAGLHRRIEGFHEQWQCSAFRVI